MSPAPPDKQHEFDLPPITVGTSKKMRKVPIPSESPSNPHSDYHRFTLLQPSSTPQLIQILPHPMSSPPVQLHQISEIKNVARSTKWYWQQREKKKTTGHFVKEYERRGQHLTYNCGKCGKPRTRDTNHHQYYGQQFCPSSATETYHEWRSSKEKCRLERKQLKLQEKDPQNN